MCILISGTARRIRRCGLAGVGVVLLEWTWACWSGHGIAGVGVVFMERVWSYWSGCGLVGGSLSLEVAFDVSNTLSRSSVFLSACLQVRM